MKLRQTIGRMAVAAVLASGVLTASADAQGAPPAVTDKALGVEFTTLPSGWFLASPGVYTPGTIGLVTLQSDGQYDVKLSVQPLGIGDTHDELAAAQTAADKVVKASNSPTPITRTPISLAGARGVKLEGMPGSANVQIIVAHAGALYDIVTFDSDSIQPDQQQALASMHFNLRVGAFPPSNPPAPRGPSETRHIPPRHRSTGSGSGPSPYSINSNVQMYVFWGQSVNAGCGSHGGALATTCGGNFYGQGDHTGQDYYAIDWPLYTGNSIFPQTPTPQVTHGGWTQGSFYRYGNWVVLDNGWGVFSYYAHMNDVSVTAGTKANWNNVIGHSGCTPGLPYCTGPHVQVAWVGGWSVGSRTVHRPPRARGVGAESNARCLRPTLQRDTGTTDAALHIQLDAGLLCLQLALLRRDRERLVEVELTPEAAAGGPGPRSCATLTECYSRKVTM